MREGLDLERVCPVEQVGKVKVCDVVACNDVWIGLEIKGTGISDQQEM